MPIKTRVLNPPKDDLFAVLDESLADVQEGDVVLITSKVVSIGEGRCVPIETANKTELVKEEAEYTYTIPETGRVVTITRGAVISGSGIDESNADGYFVLLPTDAYKSAEEIRRYLRGKHNLQNLGVIVTDSHSLPLRYGAQSVSIGSWGIVPIHSHIGKKDIFGRKIKFARTNVVDSLAAASTLVCGETREQTPIVIARNVPNLEFTEDDQRKNLLVKREEDFYGVLYKDFEKGERKPD